MYTDAYGSYAEAIRPEQVERAISVAVVAKVNQPRMPLEECVELAVDQVFCPCVSHHEDEGDGQTPPASLRAGIVASIVGSLRQEVCVARASGAAPIGERREHGSKTDFESVKKRHEDEALDDALAQTFPASDPVALSIFR